MKITELFNTDDDRAVSPVIGVILMVAITVILAAVIGTFVLGLGEQVQDTAPNANFAFDYDSSGGNLVATHDGGTSIDKDRLTVRRSGVSASTTWEWHQGDADVNSGDDFTVGAGDSFDTEEAAGANAVDDGDTIRIVWTAAGGGQSQTIARWDGPDA